jgi:hypothetical protein
MKSPLSNLARAALLAVFCAGSTPPARAQTAPTQSAAAVHGTAIDAPPPAPASTAAKTESMHITLVGGQAYRNVDFHWLASYPFDAPNEKLTNDTAIAQVEKQIPAAIKALDGQKVMVRGFLVPIKDAQGHATEFLLVRDQPTCCYSGTTAITEFVSVKVPTPGVESIMDQPVTVQGKLHVGAVLEGGYVLGVYQMDGEKLVDPHKS